MVGCWTHTLLYLGLRSINLEITLLHFRQIMQALHYSSRSACGVHWNGILLSATYMDIGCQCKRKPPFKIQERKTSSNQLFYMSEREVRPEVPLDHLIQQQCGSHPAARIHESWWGIGEPNPTLQLCLRNTETQQFTQFSQGQSSAVPDVSLPKSPYRLLWKLPRRQNFWNVFDTEIFSSTSEWGSSQRNCEALLDVGK